MKTLRLLIHKIYCLPQKFDTIFCTQILANLEEHFVHDQDGLLAQVGATRGSEGQHIIGEVTGEVRGHEAGETVEGEAGVIDMGGGDVFPDQVSGEHDNVQPLVETL